VVARAGRGAKVIGKVDDSGAVSVPLLGIEYSKY